MSEELYSQMILGIAGIGISAFFAYILKSKCVRIKICFGIVECFRTVNNSMNRSQNNSSLPHSFNININGVSSSSRRDHDVNNSPVLTSTGVQVSPN